MRADAITKDYVKDAGVFADIFILQTARIYSGISRKVLGWRSAVGLHCIFNRCAV